jgi:N,N'-diacetyllegionaminate synthase
MRCLIIAEAGVNHNSDLSTAFKLIDAAVEAGADVVKFQTAVPHLVVTKTAGMAKYQIENTGVEESQLEMTKKIHLPLSDFKKLQEYCNKKSIIFCTTAFDLESLEYIHRMDLDFYKIPSGEITNLPYLKRIAKFGKPLILSTGMSNIDEVEIALEILVKNGAQRDLVTVLHCTTEYPAPIDEVNLRAMKTLGDQLGVRVGYSDHTLGIEISIAAVAMGASVIEKHFTLDKKATGPDHKASLDPIELKQMVTAIRNIERAFGNGKKVPTPSEIPNRSVARKSIVAKCSIALGEKFTEENLTTKRPGSGISPLLWDDLIGKAAKKYFEEDDLIEL